MAGLRLALMNLRLASRTRAALFFSFVFPLIFLFAYAGIFARGIPAVVAFLFGPVVVFQIISASFFGLGMQSVMLRERGSLRRYRLAPIGPGAMIVASLVANYLLLLPAVVLMFACGVFVFHMPARVNYWDLFVIITIGDFAFAGFGLTIGSLADTMQEASVYSNLAFFPLIFLSGATIPLAQLPHWLQRAAAFLPATYLVSAFQSVMPGNGSLTQHGLELAVLFVSGIFGLLLAAKLFRWEKEERIPTRRKLWAAVFAVPFLLTGIWMNANPATFASWDQVFQAITAAPRPHAAAPAGTAAPAAAAAPAPVATGPLGSVGDGFISDFDEGTTPDARFGAGWQVTTDAISGGRSQAEMRIVGGGAQGSRGALEISGVVRAGALQPWAGAGFFPGFEAFTPTDLSAFRALSFWAKGDGKAAAVVLFTTASGAKPAVVTFRPGQHWEKFIFPFSSFRGADPHGVEAIFFVAGGLGPFQFQIDSVRLLATEPHAGTR